MNQLIDQLAERVIIPIHYIDQEKSYIIKQSNTNIITLSKLLLLPEIKQQQLLQYLIKHIQYYHTSVINHLLIDYSNIHQLCIPFIITQHPFTNNPVLFDVSLHTLQLVIQLQELVNVPTVDINILYSKSTDTNNSTIRQQICNTQYKITNALRNNNIYNKLYATKSATYSMIIDNRTSNGTDSNNNNIPVSIKRSHETMSAATTPVVSNELIDTLNQFKAILLGLDHDSISILSTYFSTKHSDSHQSITLQRELNIAMQIEGIAESLDDTYNSVFTLVCQRIYEWQLDESRLQLLNYIMFTFELSQIRSHIWLHGIILRNVHNLKQTSILQHCITKHLQSTCTSIIIPLLLSSTGAQSTANKKQKLKHERVVNVFIKCIRSSIFNYHQLFTILNCIISYTTCNKPIQWSEHVFSVITALLNEIQLCDVTKQFDNIITQLIKYISITITIDMNGKLLSLSRLVQVLLTKYPRNITANTDSMSMIVQHIDTVMKQPIIIVYHRLVHTD